MYVTGMLSIRGGNVMKKNSNFYYFMKALIVTVLCLGLIALGFISAGYFSGFLH